MTNYLEIFIPTTFDRNKQLDSELLNTVMKTVKTTLSFQFGGYSQLSPVCGGYVADNGELIEETIYPILAYDLSNTDANHVKRVGRTLARYVQRTLKQECVLLDVNGKIEFI